MNESGYILSVNAISSHGGVVKPSQVKVFIQKNAVLVMGDKHICPLVDGNIPHGVVSLRSKQSKVFINGNPVLTSEDKFKCGNDLEASLTPFNRQVQIK